MRASRVRLLAEDPDLANGLSDEEAARATRSLVVPAVRIDPGPFTTRELEDSGIAHGEVFALLQLDGAVAVDLHVGPRRCTQLLGAGDVVSIAPPSLPVPVEFVLHADQRTSFALLDDRFLAAAQRWPSLIKQLMRRVTYLQQEALLHQAISQLPRVENRLLGAFWCLADRWGSVGADGVTVDLAITHEALGSYVGAQRPTVSLGLKALADAGYLTRDEPDRWVLSLDSLDALRAAKPIGRPATVAQVPERRQSSARDRARLRARLQDVRAANARNRERSEAAMSASRTTFEEIDRRRSGPLARD